MRMAALTISASTDAPGTRAPASGLASSRGLLCAVGLLFFVSGGMLWLIGYNYDGLTGGAATKIHPFTYAILLVASWRALTSGDPVGFAARVCERNPAAVLDRKSTRLNSSHT